MKRSSTSQNIKVQWVVFWIFSISGILHAEPTEKNSQDVPEAIAPPWELYDTNEDDYISVEEAAAQKMPAQIFESLDIDRDGRLNQEEFTKAPPIELE